MSQLDTYVNRIRSSAKQGYARAYAAWMVERGRPEPRARDFTSSLSEAAAQDVRGRLWKMYRAGELRP